MEGMEEEEVEEEEDPSCLVEPDTKTLKAAVEDRMGRMGPSRRSVSYASTSSSLLISGREGNEGSAALGASTLSKIPC